MKIFIDFDDSLFNTKKFRDDLIRIFLKNGILRKDFFNTYYDYPQRTAHGLKKYDPEKQITTLERMRNIAPARLQKNLHAFIHNTEKFVFPDANIFLNDFDKKKLYLISYGYTDFQYKKIKKSGLYSNFYKVVIADSDKNKAIKKFVDEEEAFIFIDDRVENINLVKKHFPQSVTFLLKRKEGRYNDKKTKSVDFEIKDLKEATKIIKNKIEKQKS